MKVECLRFEEVNLSAGNHDREPDFFFAMAITVLHEDRFDRKSSQDLTAP